MLSNSQWPPSSYRLLRTARRWRLISLLLRIAAIPSGCDRVTVIASSRPLWPGPNAFSAAIAACERYYQAFQFVIWAGRSAREALDAALFETAGEA